MKILTAQQIREWDTYTASSRRIRSIDLMEEAARACVAWVKAHYGPDSLFVVLSGTGNNGGDGLAIARLLHREGYGVKAFLLQYGDTISGDCGANLELLRKTDASLITVLQPGTFITEIPSNIILIDAILGTGLSRAPEGWLADFISHINRLPNERISIDLPSGLPADGMPAPGQAIVQAAHTLTFGSYKRTLLHTETGGFAGEVHLLDIGLEPSYPDTAASSLHTIDEALVHSVYKPRKPFSHKGSYGTALFVGGSYGLTGAALLATRGASRAGAGRVRAIVPECGYGILQLGIPEAMCWTSGERFIEAIGGWESAQGIGIGPGMGQEPQTVSALTAFLEACDRPVVLDADAINILGAHKDLLAKVPPGSILTPHPKEFERLFGATADSFAAAALARSQAMRYNLHIVLKDRHTLVLTPDGAGYYNFTGNAGMATGGSGDVLCGIITGLLAQGYPPRDAALLGVYLHGAAGDVAAARLGMEAMLASDIVEGMGEVFKRLG